VDKAGTRSGGTALEELARLVRQKVPESIKPSAYGLEFWDLSVEEQVVFGIDPAAWPLMVETFECFEAFIGRTSGTEYETEHGALLDAARAARPDLVKPDYDPAGFRAFAEATGLLTMRQAWQMTAKEAAWAARGPIMIFKDEKGR
jgi:hypothetical protein